MWCSSAAPLLVILLYYVLFATPRYLIVGSLTKTGGGTQVGPWYKLSLCAMRMRMSWDGPVILGYALQALVLKVNWNYHNLNTGLLC